MSKHSSVLKSNHGFSLVEIMVAMGIMAVISLGMTTMVVNANKASTDTAKRVSENIFLSNLNLTFSDKDSCTAALTGTSKILPPNLTTPFKLTLSLPGYGSVSEGMIIEKSFKVEELYIDSFTAPIQSGLANVNKTIGALWVRTSANDGSKSIARRKRMVGSFALYFDATTRNIQSCSGTALLASDLCNQLGFSWDATAARCKQPLSASCADLGGVVQNNVCVTPGSVACTDLGGTWNSAINKCTITNLISQKCPSGQFVSGFDSSGIPTCVTSSTSTTTTPTPTPTPTPTGTCSGGSLTAFPSPDGSNTCDFSWSSANVGQSINGYATNGGVISGSCVSTSGGGATWNYTGTCPNKTTTTCPAGSQIVSSPSGAVSCKFTWGMASAGQPLVLSSATNGGIASGSCVQGTGWTFNYSCPDPTPTCAGGAATIPSISNPINSCYIAWPQTAGGNTYSGTGTNGGSVVGTCQLSGPTASWQNVKSNCP